MTGFNFSKIEIFITTLMCHLFVMESAFASGPNSGGAGNGKPVSGATTSEEPRGPNLVPRGPAKPGPIKLECTGKLGALGPMCQFRTVSVSGKITFADAGQSTATKIGACKSNRMCDVTYTCPIISGRKYYFFKVTKQGGMPSIGDTEDVLEEACK